MEINLTSEEVQRLKDLTESVHFLTMAQNSFLHTTPWQNIAYQLTRAIEAHETITTIPTEQQTAPYTEQSTTVQRHKRRNGRRRKSQ